MTPARGELLYSARRYFHLTAILVVVESRPYRSLSQRSCPVVITYDSAISRQERKTTCSLLGFSKEIDHKVNRHDLKLVE